MNYILVPLAFSAPIIYAITKKQKVTFILDLDNTLIGFSQRKVPHLSGYKVNMGEFKGTVYKRPGLDRLISAIRREHELAIWTAASKEWADLALSNLKINPRKLKFFLTREQTRDGNKDESILEKLQINYSNAILIDDNSDHNFRNLLVIPPFHPSDSPYSDVLEKLAMFIEKYPGLSAAQYKVAMSSLL